MEKLSRTRVVELYAEALLHKQLEAHRGHLESAEQQDARLEAIAAHDLAELQFLAQETR